MLRNRPFWITLALVVIYLLAGYFAGPRILQPRLQQFAAEELGYGLAWERLRFDPLTLSADISSVRLLAHENSPWPDISVTADTVHVRFNFWKLRPAVSALVLEHPVVELAADAPHPYPWASRWQQWRREKDNQSARQSVEWTGWRMQRGRLVRQGGQSGSKPKVLLGDVDLRMGKADAAGSRTFALELGLSGGSRLQAQGMLPAGNTGARGEYQLAVMPGAFEPLVAIRAEVPDGLQAGGRFELELLDGDVLQFRLAENQLQSGRIRLCWNRGLLCSNLSPLEAEFEAHGLASGNGAYWQEFSAGLRGFELELDMGQAQLELLGARPFSSADFMLRRRQALTPATLDQPASFDLSLETDGEWNPSATGVYDSAAEFAELEFNSSAGPVQKGYLRLRNLVASPLHSGYARLELQVKSPDASLASDFLRQSLGGVVTAASMEMHLEAAQGGSGFSAQGTVSLEDAALTGTVAGAGPGGLNPAWLLALWRDPERNVRIPWYGQSLDIQSLDIQSPATLKQLLEERVQALTRESREQPFSLLGRLLVQDPDLPNEVEFTAGSAAVSEANDQLISKLAGILSQRPGLALQVPAAYDPLIDRKALQAEQIRTHIALAAAAELEFQSGAVLTDFSDPVVHSVIDEFARRRLPPKVLAAFFEHFGEADVDRGVMPEGNVEDYYAALFELLVEYAEIPETALSSLARYRAQAVVDGLTRRGVAGEQVQVTSPPQTAVANLEGVPLRVELALVPGTGVLDPAQNPAPDPAPDAAPDAGRDPAPVTGVESHD
jgi:hypothetical protein